MKIRIISDLHLESDHYYKVPETFDDDRQTLILAGDIFPYELFLSSEKFKTFLFEICERFKNVIYVPGNHEYYHGDITKSEEKFRTNIKSYKNLYFLNKDKIVIDGISFIGACLWTNSVNDPFAYTIYYKNMSDYHIIQNEGKLLKPSVTSFINSSHIEYLKENIEENSIVITHHAPTHLSVASRFKNDQLNAFFYNDLAELILDTKPKIWIHGHTHDSFDYKIGTTRVICNPKGYSTVWRGEVKDENPYYDPFLVLEV